MKIRLSINFVRRFGAAFTLPELMVSLTVFTFVLAGVIAGYMTGLRYFQIVKPKLCASADARKTLDRIVEDVRTAQIVKVGNGTLTTFTPKGVNQAQTGNALEIQPGTNSGYLVHYYWDSADGRLKRTTTATGTSTTVLNSISNQVVFTAENHAGVTQSNNFNNRVIGMRLSFYQIAYPMTGVGSGYYYDYYELRSKITKRMLQ